MKKTNTKNIVVLSAFEIKKSKKFLIGFTVIITMIMSLYMFLFDSVKDMASMKLDSLPKEMLNIFNINDIESLASYDGYFAMVFRLILIAISCYMMVFASKIFKKEEEEKTIEFLYSLSVSRKEIFLSKSLTISIVTFLPFLATVTVTSLAALSQNIENFVFSDFLKNASIMYIPVIIYVSIAILLASVLKNNNISALASSFVFTTYIMGYFSKLFGRDADFLKFLSPLHVFSYSGKSEFLPSIAKESLIYLTLSLIIILFSLNFYSKRDFNL